MLADISNAMVRLYKEGFGRGPTRAATHFAGPDAVICVLAGTLTISEQRLVKMGALERLRETRLLFRHATEDRFRAAVEEITGREVEAFVSGLDAERDVSIEFFTLKR